MMNRLIPEEITKIYKELGLTPANFSYLPEHNACDPLVLKVLDQIGVDGYLNLVEDYISSGQPPSQSREWILGCDPTPSIRLLRESLAFGRMYIIGYAAGWESFRNAAREDELISHSNGVLEAMGKSPRAFLDDEDYCLGRDDAIRARELLLEEFVEFDYYPALDKFVLKD